MSLYMVTPKASHAIVEVATGTTIKTLLQVAVPSTTDILVVGWGVSFDGTTAAAAPGQVTLIETDVAATVTTLTPEKWGSGADSQNSLCVGGAALTGYNASAEGTIGASILLDVQEVHPQTGYSIWFPRMPKVKASQFLRIRTLFDATVNGIPWILFQEPS